MEPVYSLLPEELEEKLTGHPKYRSQQLFQWIHKKRIEDFSQAKNLPKDLRKLCEGRFDLHPVRIIEKQESAIDETAKYLFEMKDASIVEGVLLPYSYGRTFCISSQVGCARGCAFCASTKDGLYRNLRSEEMVAMLYLMMREHEDVKRVVFMGSGEPLDNLQEVLKTMKLWNHPLGANISYRNITLSTCGVTPKILELAEQNLPITLTLSLHQAMQKKREKIMPVAKKHSLKELSHVLDVYFEKTGRRISLEYTLIQGENDSQRDLQALKEFIGKRPFHVNLIEYNPIEKSHLKKSDKKIAVDFANHLEELGIHATIRRGMGNDIQGSCGQLKNQFIAKR